MQLRKLLPSFFLDNPRIEEALDFDHSSGTWDHSKVRGYGIVCIILNDLTFAIPVRSNIRHKASYILEVNRNDPRVKGMGLDYSKALLIRDRTHISDEVFLLKTKNAGKKLLDMDEFITVKFSKYVERYILAIGRKDHNILSSQEYKFTTLKNYHVELNIRPSC